MLIQGVDIVSVKNLGLHIGGFYKYSLGDSIRVTAMRSKDKNNILSSVLSVDSRKDRMMVQYSPSNSVYFDEDLVDSWELFGNQVSCFIDTEKSCIYVGKPRKYSMNTGVLVLSGVLSANQLVQEQVSILATRGYTKEKAISKVRVLSVGALGDNLVGFLYIPSERGLAFTREDTLRGYGVSAKTGRLVDCSNWGVYTIDDWFSDCSVKVS